MAIYVISIFHCKKMSWLNYLSGFIGTLKFYCSKEPSTHLFWNTPPGERGRYLYRLLQPGLLKQDLLRVCTVRGGTLPYSCRKG